MNTTSIESPIKGTSASGNNTKDFGGHKGAIINGYSIVVNGEDIFISKNGVKDENVKYFEIEYDDELKEIHISSEVEEESSNKLGELGELSDNFKNGTKLILKKVSNSFGSQGLAFEDRELTFREYIENEFIKSQKYDNFKEHMIRHIPGIVVGFKSVPGLYMIQRSVVQADKGFLLDIKLGNITAFKCDRGVMKWAEALSTNGLLSKSKIQGWRIESLRAISNQTDNSIPSIFKQLKISRKKICGSLGPKVKISRKKISGSIGIKYLFKSKRSKMKWYSCISDYLDELLTQLHGYTETIKLGDFGHPFLRTDNGVESFTKKLKCAKDKDFNKILDNFKKGIPTLAKSFNSSKVFYDLNTLNNLAFVGSSLMIAFEPSSPEPSSSPSAPRPAPEPSSSPSAPRPAPEPSSSPSAPRPAPALASAPEPSSSPEPNLQPRMPRNSSGEDSPVSLIHDLDTLIKELKNEKLL